MRMDRSEGQAMTAASDGEVEHLISTARPTRTEWQLAATVVAISILIFAIAVPFAQVRLVQVPAFVAAFESLLERAWREHPGAA